MTTAKLCGALGTLGTLGYILTTYVLEGMYFTPWEGFTFQLHLEFLSILFFLLAAFSFMMVLFCLFWGGVILTSGSSSSSNKYDPHQAEFTLKELAAMDKEEEPVYDSNMREIARSTWDGSSNHPVFTNFRGAVIDAVTGLPVWDKEDHPNKKDQRRVVHGKPVHKNIIGRVKQ